MLPICAPIFENVAQKMTRFVVYNAIFFLFFSVKLLQFCAEYFIISLPQKTYMVAVKQHENITNRRNCDIKENVL